MSTEIKSVGFQSTRSVTIDARGGDVIVSHRHCNLDSGGSSTFEVRVSRADLLAAIEAECGARIVPADAIVIDRAEVDDSDGAHVTVGGYCFGWDAEYLHISQDRAQYAAAAAVAFPALAEYLDAHPAVDEADVETLAGLISAETLRERMAAGDRTTWADIARRLLATGRVRVTHE